MRKQPRLLLLSVTDDYHRDGPVDCSPGEKPYNVANGIKNLCDEFGIEYSEQRIKSQDELKKVLRIDDGELPEDIVRSETIVKPADQGDSAFDYLVIGAHGNYEMFGDIPNEIAVRWADFAFSICGSGLVAKHSIVFLGCCQSGIRRAALSIFLGCNQIDTLCGTSCSVTGSELTLALRILLMHHQFGRDRGSFYSARKVSDSISASSNISFEVYHRLEMDAEIGQLAFMRDYYIDPSDYVPQAMLPQWRLNQISENNVLDQTQQL